MTRLPARNESKIGKIMLEDGPRPVTPQNSHCVSFPRPPRENAVEFGHVQFLPLTYLLLHVIYFRVSYIEGTALSRETLLPVVSTFRWIGVFVNIGVTENRFFWRTRRTLSEHQNSANPAESLLCMISGAWHIAQNVIYVFRNRELQSLQTRNIWK